MLVIRQHVDESDDIFETTRADWFGYHTLEF